MVKVSKAIRKRLDAIVAKRPRTVIQHLLKFGTITTLELTERYGYEHPPRAIRDVREYGIPLVRFSVKDKAGKTIAAYRFGDLKSWTALPRKSAGRTLLTKALKKALIAEFGARCSIYLEQMDEAVLQVDHRVPYEIGGEQDTSKVDSFMLLCPSANRAKSWTCEHCENWNRKDVCFCMRCFWAHPEDYDHVAGKRIRQVSLLFSGDEVEDYCKLIGLAGQDSAQETIKRILHEHLKTVRVRRT